MEIPTNRPLLFQDHANPVLTPAMQRRLQEAAAKPGTDIVLERENHSTERMSLADYLKLSESHSFDDKVKARLVLDTPQGAIVLDLKKLSKYELLKAMDRFAEHPLTPLPDDLVNELGQMRQQILGNLSPNDKNWDLRQEYPTVPLGEVKPFEDRWQAGSVPDALGREAFTDLVNGVTTSDGTHTYAVPPELCEQVYARLGKDIQNWQQLKGALQALGLPDRNIHKLYQKLVEPFIEHLRDVPPQPAIASFQDLTLDRSELFQNIKRPGGLSQEVFADLIATTPTGTGDKTWDLPPETCKRIYQEIGKSLLCWEDLEATLRDAGVEASRIGSLYRHQVTAFVQQQQVPQDSVLFLANADPDDLAMEKEAALVKKQFGDRKVIVIKRPTLEEMQALVQSGRFSRVWVAGHGIPGVTVMTNSKGQRRDVSHADMVKALSSDPAVRLVLGSICWGAFGGPDHSLVDQLLRQGIAALGYEATVRDVYAVAMSNDVAHGVQAGKPLSDAGALAYQKSEKTFYPSQNARLSCRLPNPAERRQFTVKLIAQRFYEATRQPQVASYQQDLQATLGKYPVLQPIHDFRQALVRRDYPALLRLLATPQLKACLNDEIKTRIQGLMQAAGLPVPPEIAIARDTRTMWIPKDPEDIERFDGRLVQNLTEHLVDNLIKAGQFPAFAEARLLPNLQFRTHPADVSRDLAKTYSQPLAELNLAQPAEVLKPLLGEYPGLKAVFGLIEALRQNDRNAFEKIVAAQPELGELAAGIEREWLERGELTPGETQDFLGRLRTEAMMFHVAQLFLGQQKSFAQVEQHQNLPQD